MMKSDSQIDWRAVGALVALLVGLFTLTNFLTNDKIDSKVQQHEISTEAKHNSEISELKQDVAVIGTRQESIMNSIEALKQQNAAIIKKLDER